MKDRNPKPEARRKFEIRDPSAPVACTAFGFRPSDFLRISGFGLRIYLAALAAPSCFAAATNALDPDTIPPLRPPHPELPPSVWEQHGLWIILCGLLLLLATATLVWLFMRPRPAVPVPPQEEARRVLDPLRQKPEDGALLSQVSQVVRHYVTAAFHLPPEELTTSEFCQAIAGDRRFGPELSTALADFLRRCDERKFSPPSPAPPLGAAAQALLLIDQCQARLAVLTPPAPPASSVAPRS